MALSVSTLGLFVFLLPGLLFRYFIYHESLVKRAILSANTIFASLSIILFAVSVHFGALLSLSLVADLACWSQLVCVDVILSYDDQITITSGQAVRTPVQFMMVYPTALVAYLAYAVAVGFCMARVFTWTATWNGFAARVLHGPLAALTQAGRLEMITCFVLTSIQHENRQLIYSGFPEEIGLKDGSKIDYLVLRAPEKFYLRKNRRWPQTSLAQARLISQPYARGFLFIDGAEIENVHFESWSF